MKRVVSIGLVLSLCVLLGATGIGYAQQEQQTKPKVETRAQKQKQQQDKTKQPPARPRQPQDKKSQPPARSRQPQDKTKPPPARPRQPQAQQRRTLPQQRAQEVEQRRVWQEHRARNWASERRTWQQRGGYKGYRVPEAYYRSHYGRDHWFRVYTLPFVYVSGYPRFQYGGYWFMVVDPVPEVPGSRVVPERRCLHRGLRGRILPVQPEASRWRRGHQHRVLGVGSFRPS